MAIKIGANLAYNGKLPNFERDSFETKAAMKAFDENSIDEGHLSYCKEDGNIYQYKHTNTVDTTTGRWRIFKTDIVVDAALNGTSKNPIQNKAVFDALKLKADAVALDKYQYKYNAGFVAQSDILFAALPKDTKGVDLNGFTLTLTEDTVLTRSFIINGTIAIADTHSLTLAVDNCSNVTMKKAGTKDIFIAIERGNFDTCCFEGTTKIIGTSNYEIRNSIFQNDLNILGSGGTAVLHSIIYGNINLDNTDGYVTANWCMIGGEPNVLHTGKNASSFLHCEIAGDPYLYATITENGDYIESGTIDIRQDSTASVSSKAVYDALQLKADKTQLNDFVTMDSFNNDVNQLVEEINLKLDDTVAASTYLRKDDANTTYAKKTDITNLYKFKGTKTNYADLPTTGVVTGDVWNITNANAEHGIKAGDNVAWNGTAWDNLSGTVDLSAYATKDSVAIDLAKKVDIKGTPSFNSAGEGKLQIQRIVTINVAPYRYQTGFLGLTLMCRAGKFIHVLITINNDNIPGTVNVVETSIVSYVREPLYYVHDTANSKVMLYYKMDAYDTITAKVTDKDANMNFTWEMDFTPVDALPEGAIQVHNINYNNKNLFYATPKDAAGDPKFRAIDITDIPDLSNKYGTKAEITTINNSIADLHSSLESTQIDFVNLRGKVNAMPKTVFITQAAYNALTTKDANTIYYING